MGRIPVRQVPPLIRAGPEKKKESIMISRIDHISFAVRDYKSAVDFFCSVLGAVPGTTSVNPGLKYLGATFSLGDLSRIELITPTGKGSFLDSFLAGRQGAHHICLQTPDIRQASRALDERGIPYFGYHEYQGGGWKEIFIHPRDAFGVLIQIAEFTPDDFISDGLKIEGGARWAVEKTPGGMTVRFRHPGGGTIALELTGEEAETLIGDMRTARGQGKGS
jgi:methylmalonyl-CoA/ethylmalonyl-CoA epimerase